MIEIKNITKFYGRNAAVKNLSFTVNDNEILGFLGPNGAGKSNTMNIITWFLPSTRGTVTINGLYFRKSLGSKKNDRLSSRDSACIP